VSHAYYVCDVFTEQRYAGYGLPRVQSPCRKTPGAGGAPLANGTLAGTPWLGLSPLHPVEPHRLTPGSPHQ